MPTPISAETTATGPLPRMRRLTARDVPHAAPDDAVGDAAPDAVGHPELGLDEGVQEVVRQIGSPAGAAQREGHTVVPLDERLDRPAVGSALEGHAHGQRLVAATRRPRPTSTVPLTASMRRRMRGRRNHVPARATPAASAR
jgi:hypothetical protein